MPDTNQKETNNEVLLTTLSGINNTVGLITLNRPKALNALNHNMIKEITTALQKWNNDPDITAVIIRGNGDRAFCAGGDVKSLYLNGRENHEQCMQFFNDEYKLNALIHNYSKPYIALLHGVTMGGGIGVSVHGSHKVAANNLVFAMPETGIGFFTDIGASYFLPRTQDYTGYYLGLTGNKINAYDAKYMNLVNDVLSDEDYSKSFEQIINDIINAEFTKVINIDKQIDEIINNYCIKSTSNNNCELINNSSDIKHCFNANSISEILNNLKKLNNLWSEKTLKILNTKSPSSLLVNYELFKRGAELEFKKCMQMEYSLAYGFLKHHDFYEGIRALLIDKDNNPKWDKVDINKHKEFNFNSYFDESVAEKLVLEEL